MCFILSVFRQFSLFFKKSLPFFRSIIFIVIIIYLFENNKKIKNHFYYFLLIILSLISVDSYIQLFFGNNILGFDKIDPKRLSGIFQDEFILGTYYIFQ